MAESQNQPEKKFSTGTVVATVWKNQGTNKEGAPTEYRTISFERRYLDKKTNEWKTTNTLRVTDLPKAALVLNKAYEHIVLKGESVSLGEPAEDVIEDVEDII